MTTTSGGDRPTHGNQTLAQLPDGLFDQLPAGVVVCDARGVVRRSNRRAAELWGRAPRAGDAGLPHGRGPVGEALRTGSAQGNQRVVIERPDGTRVAVLANVELLRDAAGAVAGAVAVFVELTGGDAG